MTIVHQNASAEGLSAIRHQQQHSIVTGHPVETGEQITSKIK